MGPSDGAEDFVVEEPEPDVYNSTGAEPPIWQPSPQDILLMFERLETEQVLPLKWVCPGRRPPQKDPPEQSQGMMSDEEEEEGLKDEEKRAPEPSAFDFDDTASEASAKVKLTPRTPVSAKAKQKKVARMDNIMSSLKRQQKAEREARKSQGRGLGGSPFRGGGTPSRMAAASPRMAAPTSVSSPGPGSQPGSPRVTGSPSSRLASSGDTMATKGAASTPPVVKPEASVSTTETSVASTSPRSVLPQISSAVEEGSAAVKTSSQEGQQEASAVKAEPVVSNSGSTSVTDT